MGRESASTRSRELLAGGLLLLVTTAVHGELRFTQPLVKIGVVKTGKSLSQEYPFVNAGRTVVDIVDLRTSCGCLTPTLEKRSYAPGETGALQLHVNTLTQPPGEHTWTLFVRYAVGHAVHETPLHLSAHLVAEVNVRPAALVLVVDQPLEHELVLTDCRPRPLHVTALGTSSTRIVARVAEQSQEPNGLAVRKIKVGVAADCPVGRHDEVLHLFTDDPDYRELKVPVTVVKRSRQRLAAVPSRVRLLAPPGQPFPARMVLIRDQQEQAVVIERVVSEHPALTCTWAAGPNTMATLRLRVDREQLGRQAVETQVHVYVSQPTVEVLTIPVSLHAP